MCQVLFHFSCKYRNNSEIEVNDWALSSYSSSSSSSSFIVVAVFPDAFSFLLFHYIFQFHWNSALSRHTCAMLFVFFVVVQ